VNSISLTARFAVGYGEPPISLHASPRLLCMLAMRLCRAGFGRGGKTHLPSHAARARS